MTSTRAVVRKVNPRTVEIGHRNRHGGRTGIETVAVHDGYEVYCPEHGVVSDRTDYAVTASWQAASHNDEHGDTVTSPPG